MVDCSNKNIHIFFKYVKGELTRKEEYSIDHHLQNCEDCLFNFAYVEEIYTKKHLLSSDEKTLFIKCLSDPLWNSEIEKIKKGIRQELYEEIENLNSIKNKSIDRSDNKTNITTPDVVLTSVKLRPTDSNVVGFNRENTSYKRYSSFSRINKYLVAAASIVIFAGLSTSVYLIINKATNLSLSLSRPTSSFSSPSTNINSNSPIYNIYNKITNNKPKSAGTNLYQELDLAIDEYLEHQDISYINKAREIATDIDT
ncbi:MAG: zf-HC2 domain-containing protein, partial [Acidobacteria bacterium]|nr:zf-HC2 domain-containing protein [Acidobacteriota bacterium]